MPSRYSSQRRYLVCSKVMQRPNKFLLREKKIKPFSCVSDARPRKSKTLSIFENNRMHALRLGRPGPVNADQFLRGCATLSSKGVTSRIVLPLSSWYRYSKRVARSGEGSALPAWIDSPMRQGVWLVFLTIRTQPAVRVIAASVVDFIVHSAFDRMLQPGHNFWGNLSMAINLSGSAA